jgi:Fe-S-cluster containining protein
MAMVAPSRINNISRKNEKQNLKFKTYLKNNADPDQLDAHFLRLHNEIIFDYDCCQCANCCKTYIITLEDSDIALISRCLELNAESFISQYLVKSRDDDGYVIKEKPCSFLLTDGKCQIQECKPARCKSFPHTDKPGRLASLSDTIKFAEDCPVVFEIIERLMKIYLLNNIK